MKLTKEEFDKLYVGKNIAVHCPTEEVANEFLALADSFGYRYWNFSETLITTKNNWGVNKENTVYYVKLKSFDFCYGDINSAKYYNDPIIEYKPQPEKSLFEQVLELIGLEVEQEFEFDFKYLWKPYGSTNIYKFSEDGTLYNKINNASKHYALSEAWVSSNRGLADILTANELPKINKPKSEAELILEKLQSVVDEANKILGRE